MQETIISGGGGGGSSLGGAVVGALIAGPTGAIIGSRKSINPIHSKTVTHDERETLIEFFYEGKKQYMFLDSQSYAALIKLIPEKEYSIVLKNSLLKSL